MVILLSYLASDSQAQCAQLSRTRLQLLKRSDHGVHRLHRSIQRFPRKYACLHDSCRPTCQRSCPRNQRSQWRQQCPAELPHLLSYLAQFLAPPPPHLIIGLKPPKRHHEVLIVRTRCLDIGLMPLPTSLRVQLLLALGSAAGLLSRSNSWIWHEFGVTLRTAANVCVFHPGMLPGHLPSPLLFCTQTSTCRERSGPRRIPGPFRHSLPLVNCAQTSDVTADETLATANP
jgi:hypothetical protein